MCKFHDPSIIGSRDTEGGGGGGGRCYLFVFFLGFFEPMKQPGNPVRSFLSEKGVRV